MLKRNINTRVSGWCSVRGDSHRSGLDALAQGMVNIATLQTQEVFWLWRVEEMGHSRSLDCEITEISRWLDEDYFANSLAVYCGNERIRCLIIGPESDHWQPWSLTPLLTPCRLVDFIYVTLWRCQLNTVRGVHPWSLWAFFGNNQFPG